MFEKTLSDLIRGLRANKDRQAEYIQRSIGECRQELKSRDMAVKSETVLKLIYVRSIVCRFKNTDGQMHMFGHDIEFASFNVLEVMSSADSAQKRIGYLAAIQSFNPKTDAIMLTPNLLKKDLGGSHSLEVMLALEGIAQIVTPALGRDVFQENLPLLNHTNSNVRKRAVLCMYKVYLQYPEAITSTFPRLSEKLDDPDEEAVVSATVSVIYELARQNPQKYLDLAPKLFNILTLSTHNWTLIKIIKTFSLLTPYESRLIRKLTPSLISLIKTTAATSVLYECIRAVFSGDIISIGDHESDELAALCIEKLVFFMNEDDQNLRYVALLALNAAAVHYQDLVEQHEELIIQCIVDPDLSIRLRALDLALKIIHAESLPSIVKNLIAQLLPGASIILPLNVRRDVVQKIIEISSKDNYSNIINYDWYIAVLLDFAKVSQVDVADYISTELENIILRVQSVRPFAVSVLSTWIHDPAIISEIQNPCKNTGILGSAVWAIGEYPQYLKEPKQTLIGVLSVSLEKLSGAIAVRYIQSSIKLFSYYAKNQASDLLSQTRNDELKFMLEKLSDWLAPTTSNPDIEVQERSNMFRTLVLYSLDELSHGKADKNESVFAYLVGYSNLLSTEFELTPIFPKPKVGNMFDENLDFDKPFYEHEGWEPWPELEKIKIRRRQSPSDVGQTLKKEEIDLDNIPIVKFDDSVSKLTTGLLSDTIEIKTDKMKHKLKRQRKGKHKGTKVVTDSPDAVPEDSYGNISGAAPLHKLESILQVSTSGLSEALRKEDKSDDAVMEVEKMREEIEKRSKVKCDAQGANEDDAYKIPLIEVVKVRKLISKYSVYQTCNLS